MCFTSSFVINFLIFSCCGNGAIGLLTLSPMNVAPVCRVGDPLQMTCIANVKSIRWNIMVINEHGMEKEITMIVRDSRDDSWPPRERIINSTTFTFSRIPAEDDLPLISMLAINSTSIKLNGTVVHCMDAVNEMSSASTTIQIIDTSNDDNTPRLRIVSENYSADNVTVTVEWNQLTVYSTYTVTVVPTVPIVFTGNTRCQLIILYNTEYKLTVDSETAAPCGPNTTANIGLKYVNCGHPDILLWRMTNDSVPNIEDYDGLPIEGSTLRFSCPNGLALIGPNLATCTENGRWELNSNNWPMCMQSKVQVTCDHPLNGRISNDSIILMNYLGPAMEGTSVTFQCQCPELVLTGPNTSTCMGNGEWEPDPRQVECKGIFKIEESRSSDLLVMALSSTIVPFFIISISTFIAGFLCGHYFGRKYKGPLARKILTPPIASQPVSLYEDVNMLPAGAEELHRKDFELKENVAYGPSKSLSVYP